MMGSQSEAGCALLRIPEKLMVYSGSMHSRPMLLRSLSYFIKCVFR